MRVVHFYAWEDVLQDYVRKPLDEADPWTLSLARQINGRNLSDEEFVQVLKLFNAQMEPVGG